MEALKQRLLAAHNDGTIFDFILEYNHQNRENKGNLPKLISELHNEKHLNVVELFRGLKNTNQHHHFFSLRHTFEQILPLIDAPVKDTAECVKHLTLEAGQDMTAYSLLKPFQEYCIADLNRPAILLNIALSSVDEDFDYLSLALVAGSQVDQVTYVSKAINLIPNENEIISQRAIFSLSRIKIADTKLLKQAIQKIQLVSQRRTSDTFLSTSMQAIFSLAQQTDKGLKLFNKFLDHHHEHFGDKYVHMASYLLVLQEGNIDESVYDKLLKICSHVKEVNHRTIDNIDLILEGLLKNDQFDTCIEFLDKIFSNSRFSISISSFDSFIHELHKHRDSHLSLLITKWLLSKNLNFNKLCYELVRDTEKGIILSFDKSCLNKAKNKLLLAKKACGWFFSQPVTAISLIESLITEVTDEEIEVIEELVFNPLLISYPGSVKEYLDDMSKSDEVTVSSFADKLLVKFSEYQKNIKSALTSSELIPSEENRYTYHKYHQKVINDSMKQARQKSFFASMFFQNESVLLYGNKSIHYIHHGDKKSRQETPLGTISHSFEFASMHNIDPHGLNNMILNFKLEGCEI